MALNRDILTIETVSAGNNSHLVNYAQAIPLNEKWVIKLFKAGVEAKNDGFSGNVILKFGTEVLSAMILYGSTQSDFEEKEITGDGSTKLNLVFQNPSPVEKKMFARIKAYKNLL